jgi:hypothetical protein
MFFGRYKSNKKYLCFRLELSPFHPHLILRIILIIEIFYSKELLDGLGVNDNEDMSNR